MSTNEKLFYGWTMHLPQVGRYGKHGPDFEPLINHVIKLSRISSRSLPIQPNEFSNSSAMNLMELRN